MSENKTKSLHIGRDKPPNYMNKKWRMIPLREIIKYLGIPLALLVFLSQEEYKQLDMVL